MQVLRNDLEGRDDMRMRTEYLHQHVYRLTVELNKEAILKGMRAHARAFLPQDAMVIDDIVLAGQVGTLEQLDRVEGVEGKRVVRVVVLYSLPDSKLVGILSHDISLELLRELERIGG